MIQNLPIRDREEAISLGNNLIQNKYIKHVSGNNLLNYNNNSLFFKIEDHKRFEDKDYYYLFNDVSFYWIKIIIIKIASNYWTRRK